MFAAINNQKVEREREREVRSYVGELDFSKAYSYRVITAWDGSNSQVTANYPLAVSARRKPFRHSSARLSLLLITANIPIQLLDFHFVMRVHLHLA